MDSRLQPPKLKDIADALGVSTVTVSKALRDHDDISEETRNKVKEMADKIGYRPNILARNLSSTKSNIIGLVFPKMAHFFFSSIIEEIYDTTIEKNYDCIIMVSQESAQREKQHIETLISMRIDGLIMSISEQTQNTEIFQKLSSMHIPVVYIDRVPDLPDIPTVTVDDEGGAYSAVKSLYDRGFETVGLIGGYDYINIGAARNRGYFKAMDDIGLKVNKKWVVKGGFNESDGYEGFNKIYNSGKMPEALLAVSYPVALGIYKAAKEKGLTIPYDLKVICFGNYDYDFVAPSIFDFVSQPTEELGVKAVNLLFNLLTDPDKVTEKNIILPTKLVLSSL